MWFAYDNDEIVSLVNIQILADAKDLDKYFDHYMDPPSSGGGIDGIKKEYIKVPDRLMGVDGTAYVMYAYGKRFRAALSWFTMVTP